MLKRVVYCVPPSPETGNPSTRPELVAEIMTFCQNLDFAYFSPQNKKIHKHKKFE